MYRNLIVGIFLGAAVVAAPVLYFNKDKNAFEIDSTSSTMAKIPDTTVNAPSLAEDFILQEDVGNPKTGLMVTDIDLNNAGSYNDARIRQLIRAEIKDNPSIVIDAIRADAKGVIEALNSYAETQRVTEEKNKDVQTLAAEPLLTVSKDYPYIGNQNGKVEVYYYFDVNCHYCKQIEPELDRFVKENKDVKIIHREMPILADSSRYAAQMSGLLFTKRPDKYADFHRLLMSFKPGMGDVDVDMALIRTIGETEAGPIIALTRNPKSNSEAQAVANRVSGSLKAATEAGVTGTPFIMVKGSGLFLRGAAPDTYAQLQSMAAKAQASADANKAAQ